MKVNKTYMRAAYKRLKLAVMDEKTTI